MKNEKLDEFLYKNRLKSSDLVEFWGVTKGVVSQILNGTTKLPAKRLNELLNNPHGWDVTMLKDPKPVEPAKEKAEEGSTVDKLLSLIADKDSDIRTLINIIKEKDEEIRQLREELDERKRGTATNAVSSSDAAAV